MCVLPSLIPVSCTRWANIESLFFVGFRPWPVAGVGGGHVKAVSGCCLSGIILTQQLTLAIPSDFALCLSRAGVQILFPGADTRSFFVNSASIVVVLKVTSTEELRIGKTLGRPTLAALELPLAQYVATERVLSPGGRENTCECRD